MYMRLRTSLIEVYDGCVPVTIYMVQKWKQRLFFGEWANIKGFSDGRKAEKLINYLKYGK